MMTMYVVNAFSANMVNPPVNISFNKVDKTEFCEAITGSVNGVGHKGTVDLINMLCNTNISVNRMNIKAKIGDTVYIVILAFRLEEGQILGSEEVTKAYNEGKVTLLKAQIYADVLPGLIECEGKCDEREYDSLAHMAKGEE